MAAEHTPHNPLTSLSKQVVQNHIIQVLQLNQEELQTFADGIAQGIAARETTGGNEKDLKFTNQPTFSGKPEDLDPMLREAEFHFQIQPLTYNSPTKKAYYILSLFKSGDAKLWKEQYF